MPRYGPSATPRQKHPEAVERFKRKLRTALQTAGIDQREAAKRAAALFPPDREPSDPDAKKRPSNEQRIYDKLRRWVSKGCVAAKGRSNVDLHKICQVLSIDRQTLWADDLDPVDVASKDEARDMGLWVKRIWPELPTSLRAVLTETIAACAVFEDGALKERTRQSNEIATFNARFNTADEGHGDDVRGNLARLRERNWTPRPGEPGRLEIRQASIQRLLDLEADVLKMLNEPVVEKPPEPAPVAPEPAPVRKIYRQLTGPDDDTL